MKPKLILIYLFLSMFINIAYAQDSAVIYKNAGCGHCGFYLEDLKRFLENRGFAVEEKDMISSLDARKELDSLNKRYNVPIEMQGHMTILINNMILEGHVPISLFKDYFDRFPDNNFPQIIIYQDSMAEEKDLTSYWIRENGVVKECSINTRIAECSNSNPVQKKWWQKSLLGIVIVTGLFAGIHPCTIAVLLFFMAFLYTIRKTRAGIFKVGMAYIIGIFLAYFLIGLGLLKAISFGQPHFMAKVAGVLVILLGLLNIINYFFSNRLGKWASLGIPSASKETIVKLVHKSTVPAAFVLGVVVGVCSFGCTAGIYFSILGLILNNMAKGIFYLFLYNLMFVMPLIAILIFASNKRVVERIEKWEESEKRLIKLVAGILMILLGVVIFFII